MSEPKISDLILHAYQFYVPGCEHKPVKTLTTDHGLVYACEACSGHWFVRWEDINRLRDADNG
jgi:hypothetical protein